MKKKERILKLEAALVRSKNLRIASRNAQAGYLEALRRAWQIDKDRVVALQSELRTSKVANAFNLQTLKTSWQNDYARITELKVELAKYKRCTDVLCSHCYDIDEEGE